MRVRPLTALVLLLFNAAVQAQVWEKTVAAGLTYRMELDTSKPRMVHALRFSLKSPAIKAVAELGQGSVYAEDSTKGRETITEMVKRTSALAAVNADFFPFTGDPLGLMVRNGELLSVPFKGRSILAWGEHALMGIADFNAFLQVDDQAPIALNAINQECGLNELSLFTDSSGFAVCRHPNRLYVVLKPTDAKLKPTGKIEAEVAFLLEGTETVPIQPGNLILAGNGTKTNLLKALVPGQVVSIYTETTGFDWSKVEHAVGGGPNLVRDGRALIDWEAQGFGPAFANKRHPRTAAGVTTAGDLWIVAVDGRQKISDGATLDELSQIMLRLGCVQAINLDGGGSTTLNVLGLTLNRPSEGTERPIANGITWIGAAPPVSPLPLKIKVPSQLYVGDELTLRVASEGGATISNADVLWIAIGSGWIDQGGKVRASELGSVTVTAMAQGHLLTAVVPIEEKPRVAVKSDRGSKPAKKVSRRVTVGTSKKSKKLIRK